ncbi:helix-turn-helix domain-containing protein [Cetobacterium ceti]
MNLTKLDVDLFKILVNHKEVNLNQISEFLSTSLVNTRKSIGRLKSFLEENSLGELSNKKTVYNLKNCKQQFISKEIIREYEISSSERFYYILWSLTLEREINLTQLAHKFDLNRTSLNLDMKKIKVLLKKYNLGIVSLPWKGIHIDGSSENIHIFSIKLLFKFLLEREYNKLSWDLYGIFINPFIKYSLDKYACLLKKELPRLEEVKIKIADNLNIAVGTYAHTYIEAALLYLVAFEKNINKNDLNPIIIEKMPLSLQERYHILCDDLYKIEDLLKNEKIKDKIELLAFFIINTDEKFFETTINSNIIYIKNSLEEIYNIKFLKSDLVMLNILFKTFIYKYDFSVNGFNNYYLGEFSLPKQSINDFRNILKKIKVNILNEDYFLLSLYLYQLICEKYEHYDYKKKIVIVDSSINNWVGQGFKREILKYIPSMKIEIKTIYKIREEDFEKYDYIFFTDLMDREHLLSKSPEYKNKIYLINYKSYFQVTSFLDTLLFREH